MQSVLEELKDFLESALTLSGSSSHSSLISELPTASFYSKIIAELNSIGWEHIEEADASFTKFKLWTNDKNGRKHSLRVELSAQYPSVAPKFYGDLPVGFEPSWYPSQTTLKDIITLFQKSLEGFQEVWNILQEFDSKVWVVEPETFTFGNTFRRIAIGNHAWIQFKLDCYRPKSLPLDLQFIGSDATIHPLKDNYNKNIHLWSSLESDRPFSLAERLQNILNIQFPSPSSSSKQDFQVECAICYSYRLSLDDDTNHTTTTTTSSTIGSSNNNGGEGVLILESFALPDKVCDNGKCNKYFHKHCLYEWLRSIPSTKQSFDTLYGDCPNCSSLISVKIKQ